MAIEESKISDLIARYEGYGESCLDTGGSVNFSRAGLYRTIIKDLESLLPRKSIADLGVSDYEELTGTIVEYEGRRGVLLEGYEHTVAVFTFSDKCLAYISPNVVYPLDEGRFWDENGVIIR